MSWIQIKFYALSKQYPLEKLMAAIKDNFPEDYAFIKLKIEAAFPATKRHAANVICTLYCAGDEEDFGELDVQLYYMTQDYPLEYNELAEHESFEYRKEILREDGVLPADDREDEQGAD